MGAGYYLHCPVCGYEADVSLGYGFLYPMVYRETQEDAKNGKLGATLKKFYTQHPDGAVNPTLALAQCEKCGKYTSVPDYTMYLPKAGKQKKPPKGRWSVAMPFEGAEYVAPHEFEEAFDVCKLFPHRCGSCRGKVKLLPEEEIDHLKCPHCKNQVLTVQEICLWD